MSDNTGATRRVLTPADIAAVSQGANLRHEWIAMPEWTPPGEEQTVEVCVWQIPAGRRMLIQLAVADAKNARDRVELSEVMRICEAVRDAPPPDGKPLFQIINRREWLLSQPDSAINRILETLERLEGAGGGLRQEDLYRFFAMMPTVVSCLDSIASASSACTDCPKKSSMDCPVVLWNALSPLMPSSATKSPRPTDSAPPAASPSDAT